MDNPTTPYGALVETRLRVVTWNLWWRRGDWKTRAGAIADTLAELRPDLVCLQEVWHEGKENQAALLGEHLGMAHAFSSDRTVTDVESRALPVPAGVDDRNVALRATVQGPRGPILLTTTHLIPYPTRSAARDQQIRTLVEFIAERQRQPPLTIIAGDFNAPPDSDEIRLLTGRRAPALPGWVFLDAWETAGDGSGGHTITKGNPHSAPLLLPNLRWDYIFVSWPSLPGGVSHTLSAEVVGTQPRNGVVPSDHYAVVAELRY